MEEEIQSIYNTINERVEKQGLLHDYIGLLYAKVKRRDPNSLSLAYLTDRLAVLQRYRERVTTLHAEILSIVDENSRQYITYFSGGLWTRIKQAIDDAVLYLSEHFNRLTFERETAMLQSTLEKTAGNTSVLNTTTATPMAHVNLPQIQLPKFAGDYTKWSNFRDLFTSIIHVNESLTNVQKLQYLKLCLEGEASVIVRSLPIDDKSYDFTWSTLSKRY